MPDFTNETIDLDLLPKYQDIALQAPDKKYWNVILINSCIFLLIVAMGLAILLWSNQTFRPYTYPAIGGFLLLAVLILLLNRASFVKRGYALRERDMVYKSGIIAETTSIIPLNRIQHVALNEGVFSRIYKLATLQIHTAGGGTGRMHIAGIPIDQANSIKEALLKRMDLLESSTAD